MDTQSIIQGFDFNKVEPRFDVSVFLTNIFDRLSPDDKFKIVQIVWDGYNEFILPVLQAYPNQGYSENQEARARIDAMTPQDAKWDVDEAILRDTAQKVVPILLDSYNIRGVNS